MRKNSAIPWTYIKGHGCLYSVGAGIKLIFLLGLSTAIFVLDWFFLPAAALFLIVLSLCSRIKPWVLLRGSRLLFLLCAGIIILRSMELNPFGINIAGLEESAILTAAMLLSFSAGALFFSTTTMREIQKSLVKLEHFLHIEKIKISLSLSLMLGFIPVFFEIWENSNLAWLNRKGRNRLSKLVILIPLVIDRLLEKAALTAEALEARGY